MNINDLGTDTVEFESLPFDVRDIPSNPDDTNLLPISESLNISNAFVVENVCNITDQRYQIPNTSVLPYSLVCRLVIHSQSGRRYLGTGFIVSRRCIITSGHCVFLPNDSGWATRVEVFPGLNGLYGVSTKVKSVSGWVSNFDKRIDFGAVILPRDFAFNIINGRFIPQIVNPDFAKPNNIVETSGYPADKKPAGNLWACQGPLTSVDEYFLNYMIDAESGQSGSPVYFRNAQGLYSAIGIHGYGGCPNKAIRINNYVLQHINAWINESENQ